MAEIRENLPEMVLHFIWQADQTRLSSQTQNRLCVSDMPKARSERCDSLLQNEELLKSSLPENLKTFDL